MARRTKEELLAEFHRLSGVFETACDIQCDLDPDFQKTRHLIITRDQMLGWHDAGTATASTILSGVREGLNDISTGVMVALSENASSGRRFLDRYSARTGRDFFDDAGRPDAAIKAILARGRILDDTEYRLLSDALADTGNTLLTQKQTTKAETLMASYAGTGET
ncbi:hypothetical protein VK792_00915 [Mesobacterium sp. TK19101]|uniref:Uncharacterized protein n=1 Tax=Mesobacterium hydrothermale TaxID=3111907 RepID=A0ABU6HBK4_9RHOB|nr:hypothetical protein [Mesobacterium sp. TK19101]MEC3859830.1 hypothetical protein [Mesobacterium sp. TK19101]